MIADQDQPVAGSQSKLRGDADERFPFSNDRDEIYAAAAREIDLGDGFACGR